MTSSLTLNSPSKSHFLPLSQNFYDCDQIDTSGIDLFSQEPFENRIAERRSKQLPYYIAATLNTYQRVEFFDATNLILYLFKHNHQNSPSNRGEIVEASFYKLDPTARSFSLVCSVSSLFEDQEFPLHSIFAADDDFSSDNTTKGDYYCYLGKKNLEVGDLKEAKFWYDKALKINHYVAHLAYASWYYSGTVFTASKINALQQLEHAKRNFPNPDQHQDLIHEIQDLIQQIQEEIEIEKKDPV